MKLDIVLASTSPRRADLLRQIGVSFRTVPSHANEDFEAGTPPDEVVKGLAERKARVVAAANPDSLVIAADTVIAFRGEVLIKPDSREEAISTLRKLSGEVHEVLTGVCFLSLSRGICEVFSVQTEVTFGELSEDLIAKYVDTGEPYDKAGGYGIQGYGAVLVRSLRGSYFNVMGMPLFELAQALQRHGGIESVLGKS